MALITDTANTTKMTKYNEQVVTAMTETTVTKQLDQKRSSPTVPVFHNCTFSCNITININKINGLFVQNIELLNPKGHNEL